MKGNSSIIIGNNDLSPKWLELLKKCKVPTVGLHSSYSDGGVDGYLNWFMREDTQKLLADFKAAGIQIEHQLHAVNWLLPRGLFSVHPDWFRVNKDGVRTADWNLCVSNEKALEYIENSAYMFAKIIEQESHNYYIWSDDCIGSVCYCEKCSKISGADQNMIVMKHVLKGLKRYDTLAKLAFLSYQDSFGALTEKPDKDMFLEFAPIDRNHFAPMDGSDEKNAKNREVFEHLSAIFSGEKHILEYYIDVSYFCTWKRENVKDIELDAEVLRRDLAYYKAHGATAISTFAGFINDEWMEKYGTEKIEEYAKIVSEFFG